jgi:hypothetical protein
VAGLVSDWYPIIPKDGDSEYSEGDRLAEHCERFAPGGRYYKFIQDGQIRDWMSLDCRTSRSWLYGRKSVPLPIVSLFAGACANCIWHSKGAQCEFYGGKSAHWDSEIDMCVHPSPLSAFFRSVLIPVRRFFSKVASGPSTMAITSKTGLLTSPLTAKIRLNNLLLRSLILLQSQLIFCCEGVNHPAGVGHSNLW